MSLTNYAEKKVNDLLHGATAMVVPSVYYVGLLKAEPTEAGVVSEADYGSYARVAIDNNKTTFGNAADDGAATINNLIEVRFPTNTSGSNTITHIGFFDAASAGNLWSYGELTESNVYGVADRPVIEVSGFTATVD
jgi:hypothetical protein